MLTKAWQGTIKFFKSFTLYEILFLSISLASVITVSIIVKADTLSFVFPITAIIAVFMLSKGVFIAPIYQIIMMIVYCLQASTQALWGEVILNAGILIPIQITTMITWALNKNRNKEIQVNTLKWQEWLCILAFALTIIAPVFFLLRSLNTSYLPLSVVTFIFPIVSHYLTLRRSVLQWVSYIVQNCFAIALWLMPVFVGQLSLSLLPMAMTFLIYEINNIYGLVNWSRKHKEQMAAREKLNNERKEKLGKITFISKKNYKKLGKNQNFKQKRRFLWNF